MGEINTEIINEPIDKNSNINKSSRVHFYDSKDFTKEKKWRYKLVNYGAGTSDSVRKVDIVTINMGQENPSDYKRIIPIGQTETSIRWGNTSHGGYNLNNLPANVFSENLKNKKIDSNNISDKYLSFQLMGFDIQDVFARIDGYTKIGWTWYYENGNYYLQFLIHIYAFLSNSFTSAYTAINLGNGFLLI